MAKAKTSKIRAEKAQNDAGNIETINNPKNDANALEGQTEANNGVEGSPVYLTVNTEKPNLNMRDKPDGEIIGVIPKGEIVELIQRKNADWFKVKYQDKTGYCASKFLKA